MPRWFHESPLFPSIAPVAGVVGAGSRPKSNFDEFARTTRARFCTEIDKFPKGIWHHSLLTHRLPSAHIYHFTHRYKLKVFKVNIGFILNIRLTSSFNGKHQPSILFLTLSDIIPWMNVSQTLQTSRKHITWDQRVAVMTCMMLEILKHLFHNSLAQPVNKSKSQYLANHCLRHVEAFNENLVTNRQKNWFLPTGFTSNKMNFL